MREIQTPLREVLAELTIAVNTTGVDPFEAYAEMMHAMKREGLRADVYGSSSITSGGHARNADLGIADVIAKNTDTAFDMCEELYRSGQLNPRSTIEAVALGKIRHWQQSDYMEFWLATMSGIQADGPGAAQRIDTFRRTFQGQRDNHETLDMAAYNSSELPPETRVRHYFGHAALFAEVLKGHESLPVTKVVQLVDPETSLGAQTEKVYAKLIGASVYRAALARTGVTPHPRFVNPRLVADSRSIVSFGGTTFDTRDQTIAVLVPEQV